MITILLFVGFLVIIVCYLIAPSKVRRAMGREVIGSVSEESSRPYFPVVTIFALGIGLFREIGRRWQLGGLTSTDPVQFYMGGICVVFFAASGIVACFWPLPFMRRIFAPLRKVPESRIDPKSLKTITVASKVIGVILLLFSTYMIHLIVIAACT